MDIRATLELDKISTPPPAEPRRYLEPPRKPASSKKAGALALAKTGLRLLPIQPNGKVPLLKDWPNRASSDPATIRSWAKRDPSINVGVVTGDEATRLLVLDLDGQQGVDSLNALEAPGRRCGDFEHVVVQTPRGGFHIYFVVPLDRTIPRNSAGKLGQGLDVRGAGGYVLVPPSTIDGRAYRWAKLDVVFPAPDWLLDLLEEPQDGAPGRTPEAWLDLVANGVEQGARNDSIASLAGKVFRYFPAAEFEMAAMLVAAWNSVAVRPPLDQDELWRTLDSIADREAKRRGLEP